jgi:nicotinamidase-related amidase
MPNIPHLSRGNSALAVIDIQERLAPAMFEPERIIENARRLISGAALLHLPVLVTEQYTKGLGRTVPEIAAVIPNFRPVEKMCFSAAGAGGIMKALRAKDVQNVLLCGIEAHVCVTQTCLDLLNAGFQVFVAHDATSSRSAENWRLSAERMRQVGAVIVSTEMALFELLRGADAPEFKQILELVK